MRSREDILDDLTDAKRELVEAGCHVDNAEADWNEALDAEADAEDEVAKFEMELAELDQEDAARTTPAAMEGSEPSQQD